MSSGEGRDSFRSPNSRVCPSAGRQGLTAPRSPRAVSRSALCHFQAPAFKARWGELSSFSPAASVLPAVRGGGSRLDYCVAAWTASPEGLPAHGGARGKPRVSPAESVPVHEAPRGGEAAWPCPRMKSKAEGEATCRRLVQTGSFWNPLRNPCQISLFPVPVGRLVGRT